MSLSIVASLWGCLRLSFGQILGYKSARKVEKPDEPPC